MASSSGNYSTGSGSSSLLQNSGSEENNMQVLMDQKKRKRMQSNRDSARRSRLKKQKHLDELISQVSQLTKDNNLILTTINVTTKNYLSVEAENCILRAQVVELGQRLESLNQIINHCEGILSGVDGFMSSMNLGSFNKKSIIASPSLFQYY